MASEADVKAVLETVIDPHTGESIAEGKAIRRLEVNNGNVEIELKLGYPAASWIDECQQLVTAALQGVDGIANLKVDIVTDISSHAPQKGVTPLTGVKNMIAVASGKGGVGKSTVSANLALALAAEGARVGILDADIYGPSQPRMLGIAGKPTSKDGKKMEPMENYGIQAMSIGFLIDEETPMIWRGPMVTQALEQLLKDTSWSELDYLIIDMPPGTGDIQLTLAQKVPVTGAVIVTTPQDIALLDARKAYNMFDKVDIPIIGVIENMSMHVCSSCGHMDHIFGEGGGQKLAEQYSVEHLGDVPLERRIRENADGGHPTVVAEPDSPITATYKLIARRVAARIARRKKDFSSAFPSITIQNT